MVLGRAKRRQGESGAPKFRPEMATRALEDTLEKMHGRLGSTEWAAPECVTEFNVNARLTFTSIKAHEFCDREEVLRAKVAMLGEMVRQSKNCLAFTGAGISTAAGIDDYATKAKEQSVTATQERPRVRDWKDARPTKAHRVMTAMYEAGFLKHWVQQNHDSLPQKAGFPQHALNEIHGSLHDPANPIVPYEGSLRDDLYDWMEEWELKNDLCLSLGTSLSGFNVDRLPETAAGRGQGLVIVNLQQTPYDELCSLRIFAKIDRVMELLAEELQIAERVKPMDQPLHLPVLAEGSFVEEDVFLVPFDRDGNPSSSRTVWDLREGKRLRLTGGPYSGDIGTVIGKNDAGHYRIRFVDSINPIFKAKRRPFSLWLGSWWLEEVTKGYGICPGGPMPLVNVDPYEEKEAGISSSISSGAGRCPETMIKEKDTTSRDPAAAALLELTNSLAPVLKIPAGLAATAKPPPPPSFGKGLGKGRSRTKQTGEEAPSQPAAEK